MRSDAIQTLISELEAEDIEPFTDSAIGDDIVELRRTVDRLEFQVSRRLDLFGRRRGYESLGFVSLIAWLRRACRLMPGVAVQHAEVARNLPMVPKISAALEAGDIGFHHAAVIAHSITEVGAEAVGRHEAQLLEAVKNGDPKQLNYTTRVIRYFEDPDGTLADANDQHRRRSNGPSP